MDYTEDFKRALQFVLKWEGGYVNHPADKGGETNQGITQRVYNTHRQTSSKPIQSVKYLTNDERDEIYYLCYWKPLGCDSLSWPNNLILFDFAVNSGLSRAKRYQGLCTREGGDFTKCLVRRRTDFYHKIAVGSQRVFLQGWLNRLKALKREAGLEE